VHLLVTNRTLLPAPLIHRQNLILDQKRVPKAIRLADVEMDARVLRQIPGAVFARGALGGEARAAEGLDVEGAVETC